MPNELSSSAVIRLTVAKIKNCYETKSLCTGYKCLTRIESNSHLVLLYGATIMDVRKRRVTKLILIQIAIAALVSIAIAACVNFYTNTLTFKIESSLNAAKEARQDLDNWKKEFLELNPKISWSQDQPDFDPYNKTTAITITFQREKERENAVVVTDSRNRIVKAWVGSRKW